MEYIPTTSSRGLCVGVVCAVGGEVLRVSEARRPSQEVPKDPVDRNPVQYRVRPSITPRNLVLAVATLFWRHNAPTQPLPTGRHPGVRPRPDPHPLACSPSPTPAAALLMAAWFLVLQGAHHQQAAADPHLTLPRCRSHPEGSGAAAPPAMHCAGIEVAAGLQKLSLHQLAASLQGAN